MSNKKESGRSALSNLIWLIVVVYAAFALFQFISSTMQKSKIRGEIVNRVGYMYQNQSESVIQNAVITILKEHNVDYVDVKITRTVTRADVYVSYEMETNYLFTRHRELVEFSKTMGFR